MKGSLSSARRRKINFITRSSPILKVGAIACVTGLLLLTCGSQSYSTPALAAWFMEPREPTLTQRMPNELSASTTKAIED